MKGAVVKEGVYEMKEGDGSRMPLRRQVVLPEADRKKVNLAQVVQDQMVLYVPDKMNKCRKGLLFQRGGESSNKCSF